MSNISSNAEIEYSEVPENKMVSFVTEESHSSWRIWKKRRYIVAVLYCLGLCCSFILKLNLSIAVVAMNENRTIVSGNGNITYEKDFYWSSKEQGFLLSSFFYGFISTMFLGGIFASKYGGKRILGIGIGGTAMLALATPLIARSSYYLFIVLRIFQGSFEGITPACTFAVWSRWAPPLDRSKLLGITLSGMYMGTIVGMPLCAYLSETMGWKSIFYFTGGLAFLWVVCWCIFVAESPEQDRYITREELRYIKRTLIEQNSTKDIKHPWKCILTSPAVYACVFAQFADMWGFFTMITQLPMFIKDALHFELAETGVISAMPHLAVATILPASGYLADFLISRKMLKSRVRKLFCCGSFTGQALLLTSAVYILSPTGTIICLTLGVGLGGFAHTGIGVNYLDIAPQHSSVIFGMSNTVASLAGIISPTLTAYVVTNGSVEGWRIIFFVASGIFLVSAVLFGLMASGEVQPWAKKTEPLTLLIAESPVDKEKL